MTILSIQDKSALCIGLFVVIFSRYFSVPVCLIKNTARITKLVHALPLVFA